VKEFDMVLGIINCPDCKSEITMKLSDCAPNSFIACSKCSWKGKFDPEKYHEIQESLNGVRKSLTDFQKKITIKL
jgi:DNA-directed RNA polymerase subunit RPC12/RpoP